MQVQKYLYGKLNVLKQLFFVKKASSFLFNKVETCLGNGINFF